SVKEEFVQDHRIHRDQLLALEPVDQKTGRLVEFKLRKLIVDQIEALNRAAVIVFIMADDESLRHSFDTCGIAGQRFHVVGHDELLNSSRRTSAAQQRAPRQQKHKNCRMWETCSVQAQPPRQSECCAELGRKPSNGESANSPKQNYRTARWGCKLV